MYVPCTIPYITHFYALGNTPAVSLTRGFPQGVDADILLLGCGDVRNILFTLYTEQGFPPRKLDITCCDVETAVIARNVLLFTLLLDGTNADALWDVYFHLRISEKSKTLIKDQAQKIVSLSNSLDEWSRGHYGSVLKFCDANSLQQTRQVWIKYASSQSKSAASFEEDLQRARRLTKLATGKSDGQPDIILTGLRSAAPLSRQSATEIPKVREHFWKHGTLAKSDEATIPNPMFSATLSTNTLLHYGTDPVLGFHLATAIANLAPASPLLPKKGNDMVMNIVTAAKTQFSAWVAAFQNTPETRLNIRFTISDALSFSHALQVISTSERKSTNIFQKHFDVAAIEFDTKAYNKKNSAPTRFDVIDTSNLADHIGTLNLLVAALPLLKPSASSALWIETLIKTEGTRKRQFDALLCGHIPTISLLLGLAPVDFWTNATSVSYVDELMINHMTISDSKQQAHSRLAWKLGRYFSQHPNDYGVLNVEAHALAKAIFKLYTSMFENEDPTRFISDTPFQGDPYSHFHRGSFAALIKHVQANTSTDWPSFWEELLRLIGQDDQNKIALRNLYHHELSAQLHLQGLYTEQWLRDEVKSKPTLGGFNAWKDIPAVVCVTVSVPRKHIDHLYSSDMSKINAPTLEGFLKSSNPSGWHNLFANVHVTFGQVQTSGDRESDDFSVAVLQDPLGWQGNSSLVASFYVPSAALQVEPRDAKVGLSIQNTFMSIGTFTHLMPTMVIYMTAINDASNIFVTKYEPGRSGYPFVSGREGSVAGNKITTVGAHATTQITANLENGEIKTLCGRIDFSASQHGKKLLAERVPIELQQSSPFSIDIVFGERALVCPVSFHIPVLQETAKTRIARTSGYVEVIASLADPLIPGPLSPFIYPVTLGDRSIPTVPYGHVNLDSLPILNMESSHKKENAWLTTLTSFQFSTRERELRESTKPPTLRLNFKETLFSIFMLSSGLQGGQTGLFALQHPENGNQMMIFVRSIRLNGAEGSIVADAAVIPFTLQMIESGEVESFLYVLRELQICSLAVDDEELVLWKQILPGLAERCRTWNHGPKCEYKRSKATIPLSTKIGEKFMCSCGKGKIPPGFINLPDWDETAAKYAVRIAISPMFSVPFIEDVVDWNLLKTQDGSDFNHIDKCRNCNATNNKQGGDLLKCSRCKEVFYCSPECQRKDWKKHRMECKPQDAV
ncbi:uncharacterized protein GGS22DRAFT_117733 [Annulohypoxylon maeteangense]|uniref:uncharacterized protein n=1 Tax=Annulohypoxylon maeteangense TaxID=1927788 RepID=UPI00200857A7|nr:uncharacterized protein GGS22DRAFT_117733 [Annulohypoxylon maeteangense]KAI0886802.1 hypothetical protein GGS22DRAFT_117733 [Annulohypoxylon maeteangense]